MKRLLAVLVALIVVVQVAVVFPVYAATTNLAINGESTAYPSSAHGTYVGGSGDYTNLNSDDGDSSYLRSYITGGYITWKWADPGLPSGSTINSVTMYAKAKSSDSNDFALIYYNGSTVYQGNTYNVASSYVLYSYKWTTNPATGIAWTEAQVNDAEFGINTSARGGGIYYTYVYVEVDYTPPSAPTVTTQAVTNITETTATGNGNVTSDGGSTITERGTVISTSANPTTADHKDTASGTTGAFTTSITGLSKNTTYHVRAYAINDIGTGYGADVSFTTLGDPTISTQAASQVAATTARLNSNVTFDGGEACTVKFVYKAGTGYDDYAAILAAGGTEVSAAGTYTTGGLPYYDVTGLSTSTTYSFAAKITNSVSSAYGSVLTFTTESGVYAPTNLIVIPYGTSVSLVWAKGTGSTYSLLRYSPATYPTTVTEGTSAYFGTGNSVQVNGLTPGTTYYWSIWGMSGGTYSSTYTTAICTTLAYDTAISSDIDIEVPPSNDTWTQTPSDSKLQNVPMANAIVNIWYDTYKVPNSMLWYFIWFMIGIGGGIVLYNKTSFNLVATFGAELVWFGIGSVLGLIMLWVVFVLLIISLGFIVFGHRH